MITPVAAVEAVVAAVVGGSGTRWIGIDGLGASGKTSLAALIAAGLPDAETIHIDDFARPDLRGWERDRFIGQVRDPLFAGRAARYQRWDFQTNTGAEWVEVAPGVPVILEGVSATDTRLEIPWSITVWVEASQATRLRRARERDGVDMMDRWLTDWIPSEEAYVAAQHPQDRADLIVDGTL